MTHKIMLNSELPSVHSGVAPFSDSSLAKSYMHFYQLANDNDKMYFASAHDYDNGIIRGHWIPWENQWIPIAETYGIPFVFNKLDYFEPTQASVIADLEQKQIPIYGDPGLGRFTSDKWECYKVFHDYFALTELIQPDENTMEEQIERFFSKMDTHYSEHNEAVILKPISGWQARGIHLVTREANGKFQLRYLFGQPIEDPELIRHILKLFAHMPYIVQAYVDTQAGIPEIGLGQVEFHDVRFVFYISEPGVAQFVQLYLKTPQGMIYYPVEKFPKEAFAIVEPVASKIADMFSYGVFSVDVMRDSGGSWYLTELNDQIGFNINWNNTSDINNVSHLMNIFLEDMNRIQATTK